MTAYRSNPAAFSPKNVLMLKGHTAGVGDLLRGSAAWRALREKYPAAQLHLWFFTTRPGAASEELIGRHHLLDSFKVSLKRAGGIQGWRQLLRDARDLADKIRPDMIIDFEPHGMRTTLLTWYLGLRCRAVTVGVAQVPLRGIFYRRSAPGMKRYAALRGLAVPINYTDRDFVALAALGIERNGRPIELRETPAGMAFRASLVQKIGTDRPILGLNIGCGMPGSGDRRPNLELLGALVGELQRRHQFALVLTGAPFEAEVNQEFLRRFPPSGPFLDIAGKSTICELAGAIAACRLFITPDSGPFHMSVALGVPTLAILNYLNAQHHHHHPWVNCLIAPSMESLPAALEAAEKLLAWPGRLVDGPARA